MVTVRPTPQHHERTGLPVPQPWRSFDLIELPPSGRPRWTGDPVEASTTALDRAGAVRTARRRLDLSQRDLARLLGVSATQVQRAENPNVRVPFEFVARVLAVAGMRLQVVTDDGTPVEPEPVDVTRDHAGRRLPAHLDARPADIFDAPGGGQWRRDRPQPRATYHHRWHRDRRRRRTGVVPVRHPTDHEVNWFLAPPLLRQRCKPFPPLRHQPWAFPGDLASLRAWGMLVEPFSEQTASRPAPEPVAQPMTEPVAQPAPQPVSEPASEPTSEPAAASASGPEPGSAPDTAPNTAPDANDSSNSSTSTDSTQRAASEKNHPTQRT